MASSSVPESGNPVALACGAAAVACAFLLLIAGVYASAEVFAGDVGSRSQCGTVWEPNAVTTACADALKLRAWKTAVLLGIGSLVALSAVIVAGRPLRRAGRQLAIAALVIAVLVVGGGLLWIGAIDRTVGS